MTFKLLGSYCLEPEKRLFLQLYTNLSLHQYFVNNKTSLLEKRDNFMAPVKSHDSSRTNLNGKSLCELQIENRNIPS